MTILICGDSWSAGVWDQHHTITHGGVSELWRQQGHTVINLSQPGTDPFGLLSPLRGFLFCNPHLNIQEVIWFQNDIGRSFSWRPLQVQAKQTLTQAVECAYTELYDNLDEIAQTFRVRIRAVGGLTDLVLEKSWGSIDPVCPSWCGLISDCNSTLLVDQVGLDWLHRNILGHTQEKLDFVERALQRRNFFRAHPEYFFPDGIHPNKQAHELLHRHLSC